MEIRAYIGVIGSGKDYTAEKECTVKVGFADKLREDIWRLLNWYPVNAFDYDDFKQSEVSIYGGEEGRQIMCNYADIIKEENPNYFTEHLLKKLKVRLLDPTCWDDIIGITDCRFPEEVKALLQFEKDNFIKVTFVHCDFPSSRYDPAGEHNSEKMAQQFAGLKFTESEFNLKIREMYGEPTQE
jgi:hypothetical protein